MSSRYDSKRLLIEEVKKFPPLWDVKNKGYRKRNAVQKCWKEIAKNLLTLNKNAKECQGIFKNLRDTYSKQLRLVNTKPNGCAAKLAKKWKYFDDLYFLNDAIGDRIMSTYVVNEKVDSDGEEIHNEIEQKGSSDDELVLTDIHHTSSVALPPSTNGIASSSGLSISRAYSMHESRRTESSSLMKQRNDQYSDVAFPKKIPSHLSEGEEDSFGRSVAAQLKKLHPALKARAMIGIQQVLFEQQQQQFQVVEIDSTNFSASVNGKFTA